MAFGRDLKEALGQLARLSAGYTPEVIQKKQALARLGEVDLRGKLLENDAKLERMKQLRDEAARNAELARGDKFNAAVKLQSQLPSSEDPTFVGPRLEDNGMMNPGGEGLLPGYDTASEVYGVEEAMRPQVRAVGGSIRDRALTKDRREAERFQADIDYKDSQEKLNEARARAAERSASGAGHPEQVDRYPEGGFNDKGEYGYYDRQRKEFSPSGNFFPSRIQLTGEEQQTIAGFNLGLKQLDRLESALRETRGKFGPAVGQLKWVAGNYFGGTGLDAAELQALNNMVKTTYNQAFLEGGKTLTDNEKRAFTETLPQPGDSFEKAIIQLREAKEFLETRRRERLALLSQGKRQVYESGQERLRNEGAGKPSVEDRARALLSGRKP